MNKIIIPLLLLVSILCYDFDMSKNPGPLVLIGGGPIPTQIVPWIQTRCCGCYLVVTCDIEQSIEKWEPLFDRLIFIYPEQLDRKYFNTVSAIIIEGGDQWNYIKRLDPNLIKEAHEMGLGIIGTSAGAMILSGHIFTAEKGTITSEEALADERVCLNSNFIKIKCLKHCLIDTHFSQRNRFARLKVFMNKSGATIGVGIDESTAICIDEKNIEIIGNGKITIINNNNVKTFTKDTIIPLELQNKTL